MVNSLIEEQEMVVHEGMIVLTPVIARRFIGSADTGI